MLREKLHTSAYAENWEVRFVQVFSVVSHGRSFRSYVRGTAGQYESVHILDLIEWCGVGDDLGVHLQIS